MSQCSTLHALVLVVAASVLWVGEARGQELDPERVAAVKAGMVVNFVRYTTWPESAFRSERSPIVVTVVGDHHIDEALVAAARGQSKDGRAIEVRRVRYPPPAAGERSPRPEDLSAFYRDLKGSHLVYFGESERGRFGEALRELRGADVLTVSSIPGFAESGGMLGFVVRDRRIAFDANHEAIKETGLQVSSQVLKLARIVRPRRGESGGGR